MKHRLTRHHLLPSSRKGSNDSDNILMLKEIPHNAFHIVFSNKTPSEQIMHILDMNHSALQGDFRRDIMEVLELYKDHEHHSHIVKKGY